MQPVRSHRRKTKRRTAFNERYIALSALEVQTRDLIQGLWAQSAIELMNAQSLLFLSFITNNFQLMGSCIVLAMLVDYMNTLDQCQFLESLDAVFMTITPQQQIPRPYPANRNQTFALINPRWCYCHTRFTLLQLWHLLN